ncbi:MAG: hypothetical protein GXY54_12170 [Deltaproteobacteria bacterium]|nr:hypothetical protein [Deltaproteobacteria bacterium]
MEISQRLITAIKAAAEVTEGKSALACATALKLAEQHQVSPQVIGRICNEHDIKIKGCQLGCFK